MKSVTKALNITKGTNYEEEPSAIDLAAVVFARHVYTGERHLGDATPGGDQSWTYSRAKETVQSHDERLQLSIGFFNSRGLELRANILQHSDADGIAGLRKF